MTHAVFNPTPVTAFCEGLECYSPGLIKFGFAGRASIFESLDVQLSHDLISLVDRYCSGAPTPEQKLSKGRRSVFSLITARRYFAATGSSSAYISGSTVWRQVSWRGKIFSIARAE